MRHFTVATFVLVAFTAGCASKKTPEAAPAPAPAAPAQQSMTAGNVRVVFLPVPEDVFVNIGVAAAGYAKGVISSRSIGVYQPTNTDSRFLTMMQAVTSKWSYRPITAQEFHTVCGSNSKGGSTSINGPSCSMYAVNAVLQINYIRMTRDSGFVGGSVTKVPTGQTRSETNHYCIVLVRAGKDEWKGVHAERIPDLRQCPRWGP